MILALTTRQGAFDLNPPAVTGCLAFTQASLRRLEKFCTFNKYERLAAVHFWQTGQSVPYPIQDNLRYLDPELRNRILAEICARKPHEIGKPASLKLWLLSAFGPTLCQLFFLPFNERYTAGMLDEIEPQDLYKSAIDQDRVAEARSRAQRITGTTVSSIIRARA